MQIPQSVIDEGLVYLNIDENLLFEKLGMELSIIEQQSNTSLGGSLSSEQFRQKALEYFESKKDILQNAICPNWKEKTRDSFSDTGDILVALSTIIAETLSLPISYIALAVLLAVIIIKHGINNFCA